MSCLPQGYKPREAQSNYFKFQDGDNKIRMLGPVQIGYCYFIYDDEKNKGKKVGDELSVKPVRLKTYPKSTPGITTNKDGSESKVKECMVFPIYDYASEMIKIAEITQATIKSAIVSLDGDEDFGDPIGYDIKINKTGQDLKTVYSVKPLGKTPINKVWVDAAKTIDIDARFANGNPFEFYQAPVEGEEESTF